MSKIFESTEISGIPLRNRMVRSATWEGMCDEEGRPTGALDACYRSLAKGGVGLIITGYTYVRKDGRQLPGQTGLDSDSVVETMQRLTQGVHEAGGRVCAQLVHAGGQTTSAMAGRQPLAPSAVKVDQFDEMPAAMTEGEIREVITAFGDAAGRAMTAGFDAIQLHAAHGYLINQFLSPLTNQRTDNYGGSIENRARFLMETYETVRAEVGRNYPVFVKLNGADFLEGGLAVADASRFAAMLAQAGIDAIEVSGGTPASGGQAPIRKKIRSRDKEAYNLDLARAIRKAVSCPVMVVGGFRSYEIVSEVLESGVVDYVAMARPFIREPDLVARWKSGDRRPARCVSCNKCFKPGLKEGGIYCVPEREEAQK